MRLKLSLNCNWKLLLQTQYPCFPRMRIIWMFWCAVAGSTPVLSFSSTGSSVAERHLSNHIQPKPLKWIEQKSFFDKSIKIPRPRVRPGDRSLVDRAKVLLLSVTSPLSFR